VFAHVPHLDRMASVLRIIGERSATVLNFASLASDTGIPETTLKRYVRVLQALFPGPNRARVVADPVAPRDARPKVFVVDSGLARGSRRGGRKPPTEPAGGRAPA
jgi:predicted AAA+ superfamily ATPase